MKPYSSFILCKPHVWTLITAIAYASIFPAAIMSETATIGQLRYDLNSSTAEATVTGAAEATSNIHNLSIPETVTHNNQTFTITAIGDMAFYQCDITGTLTLPKSLKIIKDRAFLHCEGLSGALNIPQSVHTIESYAFSKCTGFNGTLTLPNSITSIGECAFYECSGFTGTLTLPQNITAIKSSTFYKCSGLTGPLTIPENVTIIEQSAFMYCSGFSSLTMYDNILTIQAYAFESCTGLTGQLKLPSKLTKIESRTFYDCSGLTGELIIPENVTSIGINAFYNCSGFYGNLRIPGNVRTIETHAFWGCSGFTGDLNIPNNVRTIGESAFWGCSGFDGKLTLPDDMSTIESGIFASCSGLTGELIIPKGVHTIGSSAFSRCSNLTGNLILPENIRTIGQSAFDHCSGFTGPLNLPSTITSIGGYAFSCCEGLTGQLIIPKTITTIGDYTFYACSGFSGSLIIPDNIIKIGEYAFCDCPGITSVTIGAAVQSIGSGAFSGGFVYNHIEEIICHASNPPIIKSPQYPSHLGISAFQYQNYQSTKLSVPPSSLSAYKSAYEWSEFQNIVPFYAIEPTGITLDKTTALLKVGESTTLTATIIPDDATDNAVNWSTSDNTVATVHNGVISGINPGTAIIYAETANGLSAECAVTVKPSEIGGDSHIEVSTTKIREGNSLTFSFATSDDSSWEYRWICNGIEISGNPTCEVTANMASGIEKDIEQLSIGLKITSYRPDGSVLNYAEYTSPEVDVYRRPTMPARLLRKGDGTTRTVVTTLTHSDNELARLGYRFTYGYTDAAGSDHAISTTNNRYCRIDDNIFNNPANRLWVYSQWTFDDGSMVTSGKRYIDGSADDNFNGSSFTPANRSGIAEIHYDHSEAIRYENRTIHIDTRTIGECLVNIHSASGICLKSIHLTQSDMIDMSSLPNGIYIISATTATDHIVQKIIIR